MKGQILHGPQVLRLRRSLFSTCRRKEEQVSCQQTNGSAPLARSSAWHDGICTNVAQPMLISGLQPTTGLRAGASFITSNLAKNNCETLILFPPPYTMPPRINPRSCLIALFYTTIFDGLCHASANNQANRSEGLLDPSLRVAIVGAGVAGASAAFHLHELSRSAPISITIYDSAYMVGGEVVSVSAPEAPRKVVEAGAPHFFVDDDCLTRGMESTGLRFPYAIPLALPRSVGLWNGQDIAAGPSCDLSAWRDLAPLIARYGISAWRFRRAIASTSESWKRLGASRPFDNIGDGLKKAGLGEDIAFGSAETYFRKLGVSPKFLSEFVEPCTRARFSRDLANVSAFSAIMAARNAKENCISEGNARLIERMINLAGADVRLNSTVVEIRNGDTRRYQLSVVSTPLLDPPNTVRTEYDIVILAFPLQYGNINLNVSDLLGHLKESILASRLAAKSHVTHFSTSATISPTFFHPSLNASIPDDLLTTARSSNILSTNRSEVCYRRFCLPDDECDQCDDDNKMYRLVSRRILSDLDLAHLIGKPLRKGQNLADIDITWVHRQAWPRAQPVLNGDRNGFETGTIEIAPNLFHVGVERGFGSMEMSCRMGRNVARLLTRSSIVERDTSHAEL